MKIYSQQRFCKGSFNHDIRLYQLQMMDSSDIAQRPTDRIQEVIKEKATSWKPVMALF